MIFVVILPDEHSLGKSRVKSSLEGSGLAGMSKNGLPPLLKPPESLSCAVRALGHLGCLCHLSFSPVSACESRNFWTKGGKGAVALLKYDFILNFAKIALSDDKSLGIHEASGRIYCPRMLSALELHHKC